MANIMAYLLLVMVVLVIAQFIGLAVEWRKHKVSIRVILITAFSLQSIFIMLLILNNWGDFPWGRTSAFRTTDSFLTTIKQGDYKNATEYMSACAQRVAKTRSFGDPGIPSPTSWKWTEYESRHSSASTLGSAIFSDTTERSIEISMNWTGYKWELSGITFGQPRQNALLHFDCR